MKIILSTRDKLLWAMIACLALSVVFAAKGFDKMYRYSYNRNGSSSDYVNVYVNDDGFNYIINSNYSTGFFVLSMGFLLSGAVCGGFAAVVGVMPKDRTPSQPAASHASPDTAGRAAAPAAAPAAAKPGNSGSADAVRAEGKPAPAAAASPKASIRLKGNTLRDHLEYALRFTSNAGVRSYLKCIRSGLTGAEKVELDSLLNLDAARFRQAVETAARR